MIVLYGILAYFLVDFIAPPEKFDLFPWGDPPPPCRRVSQEEMQGRGSPARGKASTWNPGVEYDCEHMLIDYGERDTFFDFVARSAPQRARQASHALQRLLAGAAPLVAGGQPFGITVRIDTDDPQIRTYLTALFTNELTQTLGHLVVRHQAADGKGQAEVAVTVRRVQDRDILFSVLLRKDGKRWTL